MQGAGRCRCGRAGPRFGAGFRCGLGRFAFGLQLLALRLGKPQICLPLFPQGLSFVRGKFLQSLVSFPSGAPLFGREPCPRLHILPHLCLLFRGHGGISLRNAQPLALALGAELVPVRRQRREDLPLFLSQFTPGRLFLLRRGGKDGE